MMSRMMIIDEHIDEIFACSEKEYFKCFGNHLICALHLPDDRVIIGSMPIGGADLAAARKELSLRMMQMVKEADEESPIMVAYN